MGVLLLAIQHSLSGVIIISSKNCGSNCLSIVFVVKVIVVVVVIFIVFVFIKKSSSISRGSISSSSSHLPELKRQLLLTEMEGAR